MEGEVNNQIDDLSSSFLKSYYSPFEEVNIHLENLQYT